MNDKWTRVNKVAVVVSYCVFIALAILCVVLNCVDNYSFRGYGITGLIMIVPVTVSHIMWAMYIEMSQNIICIASKSRKPTEDALSDISQTLGKILANLSNMGTVRNNTPWKCTCGRVNPADANFCQNCGAVRDAIPEVGVEKMM